MRDISPVHVSVHVTSRPSPPLPRSPFTLVLQCIIDRTQRYLSPPHSSLSFSPPPPPHPSPPSRPLSAPNGAHTGSSREIGRPQRVRKSVRLGENYRPRETSIKQPTRSSSSACPRLRLTHHSSTLLHTPHTITATPIHHTGGLHLLKGCLCATHHHTHYRALLASRCRLSARVHRCCFR